MMMDLYPFLRPVLMMVDPEKSHRIVLTALKSGFAPSYEAHHPSLKITVWGKEFKNPLGLAAGFDKDAEVIAPLFKMGFGFVEVGTVTPLPQAGNDQPRVFRDIANESVINRMGFPGKGLENFITNVAQFRKSPQRADGILGINVGANKDAVSRVDDYKKCLESLAPFADYITINISSPNTAGLRNLQAKEELDRLLSALKSEKTLLLKIAPDLNSEERADIAEAVMRHGISGLIISNTTVTRPSALQKKLQNEKGGLSGKLLKDLSTDMIRDFYRMTQGRVPIVGVGGVSSAEDAYEKIRAGASLIQVYTAMIYQGPTLITRILDGLARLLKQDGFQHIHEAVGAESRLEKQARSL